MSRPIITYKRKKRTILGVTASSPVQATERRDEITTEEMTDRMLKRPRSHGLLPQAKRKRAEDGRIETPFATEMSKATSYALPSSRPQSTDLPFSPLPRTKAGRPTLRLKENANRYRRSTLESPFISNPGSPQQPRKKHRQTHSTDQQQPQPQQSVQASPKLPRHSRRPSVPIVSQPSFADISPRTWLVPARALDPSFFDRPPSELGFIGFADNDFNAVSTPYVRRTRTLGSDYEMADSLFDSPEMTAKTGYRDVVMAEDDDEQHVSMARPFSSAPCTPPTLQGGSMEAQELSGLFKTLDIDLGPSSVFKRSSLSAMARNDSLFSPSIKLSSRTRSLDSANSGPPAPAPVQRRDRGATIRASDFPSLPLSLNTGQNGVRRTRSGTVIGPPASIPTTVPQDSTADTSSNTPDIATLVDILSTFGPATVMDLDKDESSEDELLLTGAWKDEDWPTEERKPRKTETRLRKQKKKTF